jgi:anaerobic magnesium-protoporphyrin IX monomethyl ester cyclase
MKVLLVSPDDRNFLDNAGDRPPLGLCYLGRMLLNNNHNVEIIDMNHHDMDELREKLRVLEPDFIGISFTTPQYNQAKDLLRYFKMVSNARTIAGGVHPSLLPETCKDFDYVVVGEGENVINGIVEGRITTQIIYAEKAVLNIIPARELLPMSRYNMKINKRRTATLISSRGCPGHCIYCSRLFGNEFRFLPSRLVFEEMMILYNKHNYDSFYFLDDSFTADEKRLYELAQMIKGAGLDKKWQIRITTRANLINENIATMLKYMGVKLVSIGVEHADNEVLKLNCKQMTIEDNERAIEILHKHKIKVKGFFILNLARATKSTLRKTIAWSLKHCDYADYYSLVAFPGCAVWKNSEHLGLTILNRNYESWEAGKYIKPNVENVNIPNSYVQKKIKEAQQLWIKN